MPTIVREGVKLAYEDRGAGEPAFVFVHGWTCDRTFFAPQAAHFARRHRVVSVDLRGHGDSDKPEGPYPIAAYADDLAHIIDHLGLGGVVAVGHSMGGTAVLQLAAAYPERVAAVVQGWTVGSAHFSQLEVPDQVNAMIEGFMHHYVPKEATP